jgi:glucokinase
MIGKPPTALALDIGGTKIKAGLIRQDGELVALRRLSTPEKAPPELIAQQILSVADEMMREVQISLDELSGIGISLAAFITADGIVTATAHLSPEWIGYDLKARLSRSLQTRYYFALDTPAPTLGEAYYGVGRNIPDFVYVTVSTGIGAGIMIDGKYYTGGLGWAGGIGHTIIDETSTRICTGCGNAGCLETFAATQGIVATAKELLTQYPNSFIGSGFNDGAGGIITPLMVFEAAQQGDVAACEVWRKVGHALGIGLLNLINIVSPTCVVIGGGISQAGDLLLEPAREVIRERAFPPQHRKTQILQAALGDLSGIYGAAAMVFQNLRINPPMEKTNVN